MPATRTPATTTRLAAAEAAVLLGASQVARWLKVTPQTVAAWTREGILPCHHPDGGRWRRFVAGEVAQALATRLGRPVPPLPATLLPRRPTPTPAAAGLAGPAAVEFVAEVGIPNVAAQALDGDADDPDRRHANRTPLASLPLARFVQVQRFWGACDPATAELFFGQDRERGQQTRTRQAAAKAICVLCPILGQCRQVAHADPSLVGIWGGETTKERRAARRTHAHVDVPPGNSAGRQLVQQALQRARHQGLNGAAGWLGVPPATLRRVLVLHGLPLPAETTSWALPPIPATGEPDGG